MSPNPTTPPAEELLAHAGWIRALARTLVRDPALADDLVQDTWQAAIEHQGQREGSLRSWLAAIVHNVARQRFRQEGARRRRERQVAGEESLPSSEELVARIEEHQLLTEIVTELREPSRTIVLLRYYEGLSSAEIARRLGEKPATVRQRLHRALDEVRETLDRRYGGREAWLAALTPLTQLPPSAAALAGTLGALFVIKQVALVLLAASALIGGVLYFTGDSAPDAPVSEVGIAPTSERGPRVDSLEATVVATAEEDEVSRGRTEAQPEAAGVVEIAGRVEWPEDYHHADPTLQVMAFDEVLDYDDFLDEGGPAAIASAPVDGGGQFLLELPEGATHAHLLVQGRYLYSEEAVEVRPDSSPVAPVLTARAGAWFHGSLRSSSDVDLAGIYLRLASEIMLEDASIESNYRYVVQSGAGGSFEFRGVPVNPSTSLLALPTHHAALREKLGAAERLEEREFLFDLSRGGHLRGLVIDDTGAPVASARVEAALRGKIFGFDDDQVRETRTTDDGSFYLEAVPAGRLVVLATKADHLDSKKLEVLVVEGQETNDLVLELSSGTTLQGRLTFEDGTPVAGIEVRADFDDTFSYGPASFNRLRGAKGAGVTDAEGGFLLAGLGAGPFVVTASDEATGTRARKDGVRGGAQDLELTLHPPLPIRGQVRTLAGAPVASFRVHATRVTEGALGVMATTERSQAFDDVAEGAFQFDDLLPGRWNVVVAAEGLASSAPRTVELPQVEPVIEFELAIPASISGTVLSPDGGVIAGAAVRIDTGRSYLQDKMQGGPPPANAQTDEQGRFLLEGLPPGELRVHAFAEGFTWSEPRSLVLASGDSLPGVELVLALGGRITGQVFDRGDPAPSRMVNLIQWGEGAFDSRMTETDAEGLFDIQHVEPGSWQLVVTNMSQDWSSDSGSDAVNSQLGSIQTKRLTVEEGSEQHILFGEAPRDPVRVFGHISRGGEPHTGGALGFEPTDPGSSQSPTLASVDRDGNYEVVLDGGGGYVVSVSNLSGVAGQYSATLVPCSIPEVAEHRLDVDLPDGGIAGRVVDSEGRPLPRTRVTLQPAEDADLEQLFSPRYIDSVTDELGRFELDGLQEGRYAIVAGGANMQDPMSPATSSRVYKEGFQVERDRWLRDVEIELPKPSALEVEVRDPSGAPLPRAGVFVRDEAGRVLDPMPMRFTDALGLVLYTGLAPGNYTVFARTSELACVEVPVRVLEDRVEEVSLELEPGGFILTRSLLEGEETGSQVVVMDGEGREVGALFTTLEQASGRMRATVSGQHRVGPLPAGTYRVTAIAATGESASKPVKVSEEGERKVTLRMKSR